MLETGPNAIWTTDPAAALRTGKMDESVERVMAGYTIAEGDLFVHLGGLQRSEILGLCTDVNGLKSSRIEATYPSDDMNARSRLIADALFDGPVHHFLDHVDRPSYAYRVDTAPSQLLGGELAAWRPSHECELPFVFNFSSVLADAADRATAKAISDAFVRFASGEEPFVRYDRAAVAVHAFGHGGAERNETLARQQIKRLAVWRELIDEATE